MTINDLDLDRARGQLRRALAAMSRAHLAAANALEVLEQAGGLVDPDTAGERRLRERLEQERRAGLAYVQALADQARHDLGLEP